MKKILVVSCFAFSNSNRGIDILAKSFVKLGYEVDHLVFPIQFNYKKYVKVKEDEKNIRQLYSNKTYVPYIERIAKHLPSCINKFIVNYNAKKANIDFNKYDYVVLESGKPIFLIDLIPKNVRIIYRQSDSVRYIMSENKYLWELEERVMSRADLIFVIRDVFYDLLPDRFKYKAKIVINGFNVPGDSVSDNFNPYKNDTSNVVYLGYTQLDSDTLEYLCQDNMNINFHIIGECLKANEIKKLRKYKNFNFYGNMTPTEYLPYIQNASAAMIPYKKQRALKFIGLNSKFLLFIYYELPIVSYKIGQVEEFKNIPISFVESMQQFSNSIKNICRKDLKVVYDIDFYYYSLEGRMDEYINILKEYLVENKDLIEK